MYGKLLTRQVRRAFGAPDPGQLVEVLEGLAAKSPPDVAAYLRHLPDFLRMVDNAYAQNERDLDLRSRSLQLSSAELGEVNERLRAKAQSQARALEDLRATVASMVASDLDVDGDSAAGTSAGGDIESLSRLIARLAAQRQAAQERLAQSEAKFRSLTELSSDWYWEQDADLRFVAASDKADPQAELSASVANVGLRRWDIPGALPVDGTWQEHQAILAARQPFRDFHMRRMDAGGVERFVSVSGIPLFDAAGKFTGYRGVGSEITDRVRAQREVERAQRFTAAVMNAIPSPVFVKDEAHRWTMLNDAMCSFVGKPREELLGKTDFDVFPEEEARVFRARDEQVFASGLPDENEESLTDTAGRVHWILTRKRTFGLDDGRRILVGAITDITERRAGEAALRESEARASRLALVASRTHNAVIITDRHCRVEWVNEGFVRQTGYTLEEAAGRMLGKLLHGPDTAADAADLIRHAVMAGNAIQTEILHYARDGRRHWVATDIQPIRAADGNLVNFVIIETDITERKEAEEALREAKQAAEAASRAKSDFVANMSHEIRTPMNGVLGMTELLLDTELGEGQRRYARNIRNSADALLNIINDILDFSKIEAGKMELDPVDFDVRELTEEVAEMAAGRAHAKGIELLCRVDAAVPAALKGDAGRLRQVLTNLVGNAVKFTERGEVKVEVRPAGAATGAAVRRLEFSITDTGIGITPEAIKRLFTAFSQADGSMSRRFGGTGLGLAISRQLVNLMGGDIVVTSAPDRGSRFSFEVPLDAAEASVAQWASRDDLHGLEVLIVEDNLSNSEILQHHAGTWRMQATLAHTAEQAVAAIESASRAGRRFDLALIDWKLPGMSGIDLARALRARAQDSPPRMILLTSMTASNVAQIAKEAGFAGYLNKPLRREELYRTIARAMGIAVNAAEKPVVQAGQLSCGQVLLVEDNQVNQDIGAAMLASLGMDVDIAGNGIEAVSMFGRKRYDLVLMDCQMPEMDGFAATAEIRSREAAVGTARVPIVALTANAMQGDRERCLAAGMDDYLAKPFSKPQLAEMIVRWSAGGSSRLLSGGESSTQPANGAPPPASIASAGAVSGATSQEEAPILDQGALANIRALERPGVPSLLGRVIDRYVADAQKLLHSMRVAVGRQDAAALVRAAHTLKSASANIGARRPAELSKAMEVGARGGDVGSAAGLIDDLELELERAFDALRSEISVAA